MKFRNDQHTMFPTMLHSCELNNVFSTIFLNYILTTQMAMLSLWGGLQNGRAVIGLFVFKILSKNSILMLIKGSNSVSNLPKFELIQAFMHVLLTCKNDVDQIKNEGARVFTRFLPL